MYTALSKSNIKNKPKNPRVRRNTKKAVSRYCPKWKLGKASREKDTPHTEPQRLGVAADPSSATT